MSLNFAAVEEAHGAPFGTRTLVARESAAEANAPIAKPEFTSLAQKSKESTEKNQSPIDTITKTRPLDREPSTETFVSREQPQERRMAIRERFVERPVASADEDKIARILRLIEQNRTGYERPAVEDMLLYIFTGVVFLFTFDTFVQLGKTMRKVKA